MIETLLEAAKALVHVVTPLNLFVVSFIEAIFFPIPPDVVLIPLVLLRPEEGALFALFATVGSVLGAAVGYYAGLLGGQPVLRRFASERRIEEAKRLFERYDVWAIAIAGFTPIPYKVFAVAAGVFTIKLHRFLIASVISRGLRFGLIAAALMLYGPQMAGFIERHFEWITVSLVLAVLISAWLLRLVGVLRMQREER